MLGSPITCRCGVVIDLLLAGSACAGASPRRYRESLGDNSQCFDERAREHPITEIGALGFSGLDAIRAVTVEPADVNIEWVDLDGTADGVLATHRSVALELVGALPDVVGVVRKRTRRTTTCRYDRYLQLPLRLRVEDPEGMYSFEGDFVAYVASPTDGFVWKAQGSAPMTGWVSLELLTSVAADMGQEDVSGISVYGHLNDGRLTFYAHTADVSVARNFAAGQMKR